MFIGHLCRQQNVSAARRLPTRRVLCAGRYISHTLVTKAENNIRKGSNHVTRIVPPMHIRNTNGVFHGLSFPIVRGIQGQSHRSITTSSSCSYWNRVSDSVSKDAEDEALPGSKAFVECDREALIDLFHKYATNDDDNTRVLDLEGLGLLLKAVGENLDKETLTKLFETADLNGDGSIELDEFLIGSDKILGSAPAGIVLVVGGPGSGKGVLSTRLEEECGVVHLSSGDLLRDEVKRETVLGKEVRDIMARGELVSSAVIVTLMRRVMRNHPGKRVLLDGFPRSLQNAHDLIELCGKPELALHLECDDTILMERILKRGAEAAAADNQPQRADDNVHTALKRLRTYHTFHTSTMQWLREQHVPVVNIDCSGSAESVWEQLCAVGRLMRPATRITTTERKSVFPPTN